ncbi:unnamed protein product [Allacma fusca]|uniref:Uncharacterized protein n=1 Tax=Allacma fusca TaxID=39272 RepID=A0A8J2P882_9HEXA|nr:unnamed protein product [Allacma fusca]
MYHLMSHLLANESGKVYIIIYIFGTMQRRNSCRLVAFGFVYALIAILIGLPCQGEKYGEQCDHDVGPFWGKQCDTQHILTYLPSPPITACECKEGFIPTTKTQCSDSQFLPNGTTDPYVPKICCPN